MLIVIECKVNIKNNESSTRGQYAVDGVKLHSSFLSKEYDVLAIAVSGQDKLNIEFLAHIGKIANFRKRFKY